MESAGLSELLTELSQCVGKIRAEYDKYVAMAKAPDADDPTLFAAHWVLRELRAGIEEPAQQLAVMMEA